MKILRRLLLIVLVVAALATIAGLLTLRSFGEPALRSYVAKLRSQGERLTMGELSALYSSTTNRTLAEITNFVARFGLPPVNVTNFHLTQWVEPSQPRVAWNLKRFEWWEGDCCTNASWSDLEKSLAPAAPALRHLQSILEKPAPHGGRPQSCFQCSPVWQETRVAATWLACAALGSLHEGRLEDTLLPIRALAGLANLHHEEAMLAHQMTRVALAEIGLELTWHALQANGWSPEQLAALQNSWQENDLLAAVEKGLEGERAIPLELLSAIREHKTSAPGVAPANQPSVLRSSRHFPLGVFANDVLYGLRHVQSELELVREMKSGRPYSEVMEALGKLHAQRDAKAHSVTRYFYLISLIAIPDYRKAVTQAVLKETKRRLAITDIALRRYELKYGRPPPTLAALVPEFLGNVPRDCMDGKALKYLVNQDGTLTLYSVGIDGRDDGGDPTPAKTGTRMGLCEGRDAVWPMASKASAARLRADATP